MEMGRRRDRDRIDVQVEQFADIGDRGAAQGAGDEIGLLAVGIGDGDQFDAGQPGEHAGMIAAHDADADDADAQRAFCTRYCSLRHVLTISPDRANLSFPSRIP